MRGSGGGQGGGVHERGDRGVHDSKNMRVHCIDMDYEGRTLRLQPLLLKIKQLGGGGD